MADKGEYFELTGTLYNVRTRKPNQFDKFQTDIVLTDPAEIQKAEELEMKYGLKLKDQVKFMRNGKLETKGGVTCATFSAKHIDSGQYPRKFIPTTNASDGSVVTDLVEHGATGTVRIKVYPYSPGTNAQGYAYKGGYGFQLENVKLHNYTPYKASA